MHLGLLSSERLSFDPLKPILLSGPATEESTVAFSGNVVLSLGKPTKVVTISVSLKTVATTFWPEGIGARGTRLSYEKTLSEQTVQVLDASDQPKGYIQVPSGIHRFVFTFVVPNSIVETIDDVYGRVKHTVEARVTSPGISLLNSWHISKPVLVLRTYLSTGMLTNHSVQDLSRTFEKHLTALDLQLIVEKAAFSSGDLFHIRCIMQPQIKHLQLEHLDMFVIESRRFAVPEMHALRTDSAKLLFTFLTAHELDGGSLPPAAWAGLLGKQPMPIPVHDTVASRLTFASPTCVRNCHHSTTFKEILFRHHLSIHLTFSYPDYDAPQDMASMSATSTPTSSRPASPSHSPGSSAPSTPTGAEFPSSSTTWLPKKLRKQQNHGTSGAPRKRETLKFELPIDVYDCRLKEDFGRLPSYFELSSSSPAIRTPPNGKNKRAPLSRANTASSLVEPDAESASSSAAGGIEPHVFLCPCYFSFRRQVERASQVQLLPPPFSEDDSMPPLDKIPSKPPPEYVQ
ncbi:hypothetical protein BC940DRAFT_322068 [Gongronella butleri]|nr:hypothetical protein BC940DRAFT_322068 [Gongronella butleri]